MWQGLLRNYLLGQARQAMQQATASARDAAQQNAQERSAAGAPDDPSTSEPAERSVCHVGLVFALGIEAGGLVDRLSGVIGIEGAGCVAREGGLTGRRIVVVHSGVGRTAAQRATEALLAGHQPRWILSAGFAGGLAERLAQNDILLADQIVDSAGRQLSIDVRFPSSQQPGQPRVHVGRLLTVDRIVRTAEEKRSLGASTGALAVDMESLAVADICRQHETRFLAVRVISDTIARTLPRDIDHLVSRTTTASRLGAAAGALVRRPSSLKDMWQLKEDALIASEHLAGFLSAIIRQLP